MDQEGQQDRKLTAAARQREALTLRAQGLSYEDIAQRLGYRGRSGAWKAVDRALQKVQHEGVGELRILHSLRLGQIIASLWDKRDDPRAARAILGCLEREAKLYGIDAPSRVEISRLLESEDWARVRTLMQRTLEPWPEAARAVAAALLELDGEHS